MGVTANHCFYWKGDQNAKLNESYEAVTVTPEGSNIGVNIGIDKFYDAINKEKKVSVGVTGTFKPRIFDRVDFIEQKVLPAIGVG